MRRHLKTAKWFHRPHAIRNDTLDLKDHCTERQALSTILTVKCTTQRCFDRRSRTIASNLD
jgi:hypothetical protein